MSPEKVSVFVLAKFSDFKSLFKEPEYEPQFGKYRGGLRTEPVEASEVEKKMGEEIGGVGQLDNVSVFECVDFSYSARLGTNPSGGSVTVIGPPGSLEKALSEKTRLDIGIVETKDGKTTTRQIKKLRIVRWVNISPETLPPFENLRAGRYKAYRVDFEDFRFVLRGGGVFGDFNIVEDIDSEGRMIFRENSLDEEGKPWSYRKLVRLILESWAFSWNAGGRNVDARVVFLPSLKTEVAGEGLSSQFPADARFMLDKYPLNKRWRAAPRNSVVSELLTEVSHDLTVNDEGDFVVIPSREALFSRRSASWWLPEERKE